MKEDDDIEKLFKKSFENFEPEVNSTVWKNIQTGLKVAGIGVLGKVLINKIGTKTIVAILSSATIIGSAIAVITRTENASDKPNVVNNKINVVPESVRPAGEKVAEQRNPEMKEFLTDSKTEEKTVINEQKENVNEVKTEPMKTVSKGPIAVISASSLGGTAPLIVSLSNTGVGKINKWTCTDGKEAQTDENPVHIFEEPGIYTVKLISKNAEGKMAMDSIRVEVTGNSSTPLSDIPADYSFSPNGDKNNDVFKIKLQDIANLDGRICDADGNVVQSWKSWDGNLLIWNGKDNKGEDVKEGKYFYLFNTVSLNGKKRVTQGSVNLTR